MAPLYSNVADGELHNATLIGNEGQTQFCRLSDVAINYVNASNNLITANMKKQIALVWQGSAAATKASHVVDLNTVRHRYVLFILDAEQTNPTFYAIEEINYTALAKSVDLVPIYYVRANKWERFQIRHPLRHIINTAVLGSTATTWNTPITAPAPVFAPGALEPIEATAVQTIWYYYDYNIFAGAVFHATGTVFPDIPFGAATNTATDTGPFHYGYPLTGILLQDPFPDNPSTNQFFSGVFQVPPGTTGPVVNRTGNNITNFVVKYLGHYYYLLNTAALPPDPIQDQTDWYISPNAINVGGSGLPIIYNQGKRDMLAATSDIHIYNDDSITIYHNHTNFNKQADPVHNIPKISVLNTDQLGNFNLATGAYLDDAHLIGQTVASPNAHVGATCGPYIANVNGNTLSLVFRDKDIITHLVSIPSGYPANVSLNPHPTSTILRINSISANSLGFLLIAAFMETDLRPHWYKLFLPVLFDSTIEITFGYTPANPQLYQFGSVQVLEELMTGYEISSGGFITGLLNPKRGPLYPNIEENQPWTQPARAFFNGGIEWPSFGSWHQNFIQADIPYQYPVPVLKEAVPIASPSYSFEGDYIRDSYNLDITFHDSLNQEIEYKAVDAFSLNYDGTSTVNGININNRLIVFFDGVPTRIESQVVLIPGGIDPTKIPYTFGLYANRIGPPTINSGDLHIFDGTIFPRPATWQRTSAAGGIIVDNSGAITTLLQDAPLGNGAFVPFFNTSEFPNSSETAQTTWPQTFNQLSDSIRGTGTFPRPTPYGFTSLNYFVTDKFQLIFPHYNTPELAGQTGFYMYYASQLPPSGQVGNWYTAQYIPDELYLDAIRSLVPPPGTIIRLLNFGDTAAIYLISPYLEEPQLTDTRQIPLAMVQAIAPLAFPLSWPVMVDPGGIFSAPWLVPFIDASGHDIHKIHSMILPYSVNEITGGVEITNTPNNVYTALSYIIAANNGGGVDGTSLLQMPRRMIRISGVTNQGVVTQNGLFGGFDGTLGGIYNPLATPALFPPTFQNFGDVGLPHWRQGYAEDLEDTFGIEQRLVEFARGDTWGYYSYWDTPQYEWHVKPTLKMEVIPANIAPPQYKVIMGLGPSGAYIELKNYQNSYTHQYGFASQTPVQPLDWFYHNKGNIIDLTIFNTQLSAAAFLYSSYGTPNYVTPMNRYPAPYESAYPFLSFNAKYAFYKDTPFNLNYQTVWQTTDPGNGFAVRSAKTNTWVSYVDDQQFPLEPQNPMAIKFCGNPEFSCVLIGTGQTNQPATYIIDDDGGVEQKNVTGITYSSLGVLYAIDATTGNLIRRTGGVGTAWVTAMANVTNPYDTVLLLQEKDFAVFICIHGTNNIIQEDIISAETNIITRGTQYHSNTIFQSDPSRDQWPAWCTGFRGF